jgi:hypothetical protein
MSKTIPKPPPTERTFPDPWKELDYLCRKMSYWLYIRRRQSVAERYLSRLARGLKQLPHN